MRATGQLPEPTLQDSHDLIVQVHAASLNPLDTKRRQGTLKMIIRDQWPQIIGYDISGVVVACGASVTKFRVGDEVFAMLPHNRSGALADHVEAASLPLVSLTALQVFRHGQLQEGKKVFITAGAGGVGSIAIQIAKTVFKASKVATTTSARKTEKLKELGADRVVDYTRESFERELTAYDFAFDCTGEARRCFDCITPGGTVISIAETPSYRVLRDKEAFGLKVSGFVGLLLNCLGYSVARKARAAQIEYDTFFCIGDGAVLDEIRQLCESKALVPVVDRVFPFEKADAAIAYLDAGHATGKVVVQLV